MYTPGPWLISKYRSSIYTASDEMICVFYTDHDIESFPNTEGNINLIAAAPEMYEALKALLAELDDDSVGAGTSLRISHARRVLAKAEGRE